MSSAQKRGVSCHTARERSDTWRGQPSSYFDALIDDEPGLFPRARQRRERAASFPDVPGAVWTGIMDGPRPGRRFADGARYQLAGDLCARRAAVLIKGRQRVAACDPGFATKRGGVASLAN